MANPKTDAQKLRALIDSVENDLLSASDEEIWEDIQATEDPEQVIKQTKNVIHTAITTHRQKKLHVARESYDAVTHSKKAAKIPSAPHERRTLLQRLINSDIVLPDGLTLAFREGKGLSDADIESTLEDLAELGLLKDEKK